MVPKAADTKKWFESTFKEIEDMNGRLHHIPTDETSIDEKLLLGSEMSWLQSRVRVSSLSHQWFAASRYTFSAVRSILRDSPWEVLSSACDKLYDIGAEIHRLERRLDDLFMISELKDSHPLLHHLEIYRYQALSQFDDRLAPVREKTQQIEARKGSIMFAQRSSYATPRLESRYWRYQKEQDQLFKQMSKLKVLHEIATSRLLEQEAARNPRFAIYLVASIISAFSFISTWKSIENHPCQDTQWHP
ncbi:uncharacterized protein BDZ99DRAFT_303186 [Mytilinidion resinicola]|uniref:Uncharacterized protein n=1 Tax=Mytilinidion resinicola TaxID=574789 RepID=A0A6A6YMU3_9PEZI|nr:uncharacterized protein BDZ99DRAFT_303186 [Mytilinidion resinicola]KAF2810061.1 hypothetical protein BDZ99DRAFT_303186 [Mytilinidion resinicola]